MNEDNTRLYCNLYELHIEDVECCDDDCMNCRYVEVVTKESEKDANIQSNMPCR